MIRPIDLQNTILAAQTAGVQRAEEAPRLDAQAAQAAFATDRIRRDEQVAPAADVLGNRVSEKQPNSGGRQSASDKRRHVPLEASEAESDSSEEPPHIIDCMA